MDNEFLSFVTQFDLVFCSETWQRRNDKLKSRVTIVYVYCYEPGVTRKK